MTWHKYKDYNLNLVAFGLGEHVLAEHIVIVCFMDTVPQDTDERSELVLCGLQNTDLRTGQKVWMCFNMNQLIELER